MATKLIELGDGLLVEVEADEEAVQQISAGSADWVERAPDGAQILLKKDGLRYCGINLLNLYPQAAAFFQPTISTLLNT
jgi:hypothetical protein